MAIQPLPLVESPEKTYLSAFASAEAAIKASEVACGYVCSAAINELRCAGRHYAEYQLDPTKEDDFKKAINHCHRSIYDAYEEGLFYLLLEFDNFHQDYRAVEITRVLPDYVEEIKVIQMTQALLREIAEDSEKDRADRHADCQAHYDEMIEILNKFTRARPELNKIIRGDKRRAYRIWFGLIVVGIVVPILVLLITIMNSPVAPASP